MKIIYPNGRKVTLDEAHNLDTENQSEWEFWTKVPEKRGSVWVASLNPISGILVVSDDFCEEIEK